MSRGDHFLEVRTVLEKVPEVPDGEKVPFLMHLRAKLKWEAAKDPYMAPSLMGGRSLHPFENLLLCSCSSFRPFSEVNLMQMPT